MFNESQWHAICHERGAAMVLAGPGTGKTTVITERVRRLIEERIALPQEILVVTFTKAASLEMKERFEKITNCNPSCNQVTFGTFHSVFYQMLRRSGGGADNVQVLDENDKRRILSGIVMRLKVENTDLDEFVQKVADQISKFKGERFQISGYENGEMHNSQSKDGKNAPADILKDQIYFQICDTHTFFEIYREYEDALKLEKKIDFEDMIWKCHKMLAESPDKLQYWRSRYKYILVDEFQDINKCQYENIKLLAGESQNVFVVGDDDQSIYGFRGAGPKLMFDFQKEYRNTVVINLKINYRCTAQIIKVSDGLIGHNEMRYKKKITSYKGEGEKFDFREFETSMQQYEYMAKKIKAYIADGIKPEQIAILARNNDSIPLIRNFLFDRRINSETRKKENLYKHPIAKDIICYMKAAYSDLKAPINENHELVSILNKPERFIGLQTILDGVDLKGLKGIYTGCKDILKNINELEMHLAMIKKLTPFAAVNYIKYGVNYDKYMRECATKTGTKYEEASRVFGLVQQDASRYNMTSKWLEKIEDSSLQMQGDTGKKGISILTMHASKGLEFPVVFIPDVNQGVIPGMRAVRECDIEEERRVFYVALTRASMNLHVLIPKQVMGRKLQPSQFINEMSTDLHF